MKILWRLIKTFLLLPLLFLILVALAIGVLSLIVFFPIIAILIAFAIMFFMAYTIIKESEDEK